ncbi:hypothetical protein H6P81_000188 [Aristolochia fimbriata]|uniref:AT1G17665-like protein n=1 Tax=Aristolochia fimbriata TaxID=158543 RepID=A0AAV7F5U5_ARIFI|nr:hypothetical protein H6P81_000188 [Aristolochia fimbriata]
MAASPLHCSRALIPFCSMEITVFTLSFVAFSLMFLFVYLYNKQKNAQNPTAVLKFVLSRAAENAHQSKNQPLIVEILTSDHSFDSEFRPSSPAVSDAASAGGVDNNSECLNGSEFDAGEDCERSEELKGKRRKKRGKKKRQGPRSHEESQPEAEQPVGKENMDWLYPFTSSSSVTQRKIKQHYDQLVKSNDAKALTMAQVGQFANCLIEARSELQHKSETIQRKFTITKALLFKADRSSFDRLCQQIYKLEAEQKRLEEDTLVYNRLQEQLKLSPAYKKMLEVASRMESQTNSDQVMEDTEAEFSDISFEELLAQEKKDSFWQKNGKLKSFTTDKTHL